MARKSFFVRQAKAAQMPPNRDTVGFHALDFPQFDHQLIKGQITLFPDPTSDPVCHPRQLAMPTTVALLLASSDPVVRFKMTMSFTNLIETRNCAAAARCVWSSPTKATTRRRSSIGSGLPINDPQYLP